MVLGLYSYYAGEWNSTSWSGLSCCCSLALWAWLKYCFRPCFLASRKLWTHSMLTGKEDLLGCWKVLLCRISSGEGMLGHMGVECRSRRSSASDLLASCILCAVQHGFNGPNLSFYKAIRLRDVRGQGYMINMVVPQELGELIRCEWGPLQE